MKRFYPVIESVKTLKRYELKIKVARAKTKAAANNAFTAEYNKNENRKFNFIESIEVTK